ncbi:PAAR domain-containing protein [Burkholderia sp. MSHR3999]|uniref:PAAR domain-containing protein n=1 Tax=Burkholderia sp. MSHR3999 TaxID=1542965 RepID=UPI0005ACCCFC|nr:PAAR domain-containing protein [Burkholderia sp. MSHR3999]
MPSAREDPPTSSAFTASGGTRSFQFSDTMDVMGRKAARRGDLVSCPIEGHGVNPIIEGSDMILDNGVPIALHGHRCACGCQLIAFGTDATLE